MKQRKARSGTIAAKQEALRQALAGWPEPPANVPLRKHELAFWRPILICRLPEQWHEADLINAANLARCYGEIEQQRARLYREGDMVGDPPRLNPRHGLIETLNRRALAIVRVLQLHGVATIGKKGDAPGVKGEAAGAAAALEEVKRQAPAGDEWNPDDLLAKPTRLQ